MKNGYSQLIQSRYFITDFNSAIFDGPIRIYFTQVQESLALKVYFHIQSQFVNEVKRLKDVSMEVPFSLFILIYPNANAFLNCFESDQKMALVDWESDLVLGINECASGVDFSLFDMQFQKAYAIWVEQSKKLRNDEINL